MDGLYHSVPGDTPVEWPKGVSQAVLLSGLEIKVMNVTPTRYGRDISVPKGLSYESVNLKVEDQAYWVDYSAEKEIEVCRENEGSQAFSSWTIALPLDPYHAYWSVLPSDQRLIEFHGVTRLTNPCASAEIATIESPKLYWYTWRPGVKGLDARNSPFNCEELLHQGRDYELVKAEFHRLAQGQSQFNFRMFETLPVWSVHLFFGFVSDQPLKQALSDASRFFREHNAELRDSVQFKLESLDRRTQDASVWAVVEIINSLKDIARVQSIQVDTEAETGFSSEPSSLRLRIKAQMKLSAKPLILKIRLGDASLSLNSDHYKINSQAMVRALKEDAIVFYIGHARFGENLNWLSLSNDFSAKQSYQMLGVISCFSADYFVPSYPNWRAAHGLVTDVLLVNFATFRYLLPVGVLRFFDQDLAGQSTSLQRELERFIGPDEVAIVNRVQ